MQFDNKQSESFVTTPIPIVIILLLPLFWQRSIAIVLLIKKLKKTLNTSSNKTHFILHSFLVEQKQAACSSAHQLPMIVMSAYISLPPLALQYSLNYGSTLRTPAVGRESWRTSVCRE